MKCKYGDRWLTGTPWQEDCGSVLWSAQQLVNVAPIFRAGTPNIRGRGNVTDILPVPIVLQLSSPLEALAYLAELPWTLADSGELRFEEILGVDRLTIVYPTAAWQGVDRQRIGECAVELTYQFVVSGPPTIVTDQPAITLETDTGLPITDEQGNPIVLSP